MLDSADYYRLTESSYLALCPEQSSHMNMGVWPAATLRPAQEALIEKFIHFFLAKRESAPKSIVDAGSGWGGSRMLFHKAFPETSYLGVNSSINQIDHAKLLTRKIPNTSYVHSSIENIASLSIPKDSSLLSIEAAFHFENKEQIFQDALQNGIKDIAVADICISDPNILSDFPLLYPGLRNAWRISDYENFLPASGFAAPVMEDISSVVFEGMATYLESLDRKSFQAQKRILDQFKISFRQMDNLGKRGELKYVFIYSARL